MLSNDAMQEELEGMSAVEKLETIQGWMMELLEEARKILKKEVGGMAYERADAYWLAHVETALKKETRYLGGSMVTMDDTIEEVREVAEEKAEEVALAEDVADDQMQKMAEQNVV
jgi:hypothetical protein